MTFIADERFQSFYVENTGLWTLQIKYVQVSSRLFESTEFSSYLKYINAQKRKNFLSDRNRHVTQGFMNARSVSSNEINLPAALIIRYFPPKVSTEPKVSARVHLHVVGEFRHRSRYCFRFDRHFGLNFLAAVVWDCGSRQLFGFRLQDRLGISFCTKIAKFWGNSQGNCCWACSTTVSGREKKRKMFEFWRLCYRVICLGVAFVLTDCPA